MAFSAHAKLPIRKFFNAEIAAIAEAPRVTPAVAGVQSEPCRNSKACSQRRQRLSIPARLDL
jgi:hypothetical protein